MMLIAVWIAALLGDAAVVPIAPPLHITLWFADNVPESLARRMTDEADAVWRPNGVTFVWERAEKGRPAGPLEVIVDNDHGTTSGGPPLGWIRFDAHDAPGPLIHMSYANVVALLQDSNGVVGNLNEMPITERETYLGRAMGRALAHELGHYLLASKAHSRTGLMRSSMTAVDLFSTVRMRLEITQPIRESILTRLVRSGSGTVNP